MLRRMGWMILGAALALVFVQSWNGALAYDPYVLNNLKKSRDALLDQRSELQRAYDQNAQQIDVLQQKQARLDNYLKQIEQSLRDVNRAIDQSN